jgi:hypothetical protein
VARTWETFKVKGDELLQQVKRIIHEGNVRRVVIKQGARTVVEFPVTVGVVGALAAPVLAMLGAMAAFISECTIAVEREARSKAKRTPRPPTRKRGARKRPA